MAGKQENKQYGNESIKMLKGPQRVRLRPSVIFGSDSLEGACHAVFEIISNSIDEAREGYGDKITVIRHSDGSITVSDRGRGTPVDYNEAEERYNYELIYEELYAGGKYATNQGENYEYSLGLNGLGCCATQYASAWMDVEVKRDGYLYNLHFEKGANIGGLQKKKDVSLGTYTKTRFKLDDEVFNDTDIPSEYFEDILKRQAVTNKGITFDFLDEENGESFEYYYPTGILGYVEELAGEKAFTSIRYASMFSSGRDREDKPEYKMKAEMSFTFSNDVNDLEYYHNSSFLANGGSPDKAVRSAFTGAVDQYLKTTGRYLKNEKKITFNDLQESLVVVINSFSTMTSYENQTKKAINNKFIQEALTEFIRSQLEIYFIENKDEAEKIAGQILINKRSRENAEKTRTAIKKTLAQGMDPLNRIKKFVDCRTKDILRRELYIVEGDSALGSCKLARDAEFQAIIPIRGKILNCLKSDYNKIFANEIITDIIKVLGTGVEVKNRHVKDVPDFDLNQLRWDKIIICTDADVDGFQIRTLLLSMFYRLTPTLIEEGKIFIAESPLFEISTGKHTYFAYNEKEKQRILSTIKSEARIQRSKGLGENEPEMMWQTTMNPETRRLIQVIPQEADETKDVFELLLGDDLAGRKDYIETYGHLYLDRLDES